MGPGQSITHTGRLGFKDRCEGKLFGKSETTSSLARAYGINMHLFFPESACEGFFVKKQPLY